jgi:hypothetical protein
VSFPVGVETSNSLGSTSERRWADARVPVEGLLVWLMLLVLMILHFPEELEIYTNKICKIIFELVF